jgi:hypothetical protein
MFIKIADTYFNVAHIVAYGDHWVQTSPETHRFGDVKATQITALLNEACRRMTGHNAVVTARDLEPT